MNENYVPCEIIFPNWKNARITLIEFVDNIGTFTFDIENYSLSLKPVSLNNIKNRISLIPEDEQEYVYEILTNSVDDYYSELLIRIDKCFLNKKINQETLYSLQQMLDDFEKEKLNNSFKSFLLYKYGLLPAINLELTI